VDRPVTSAEQVGQETFGEFSRVVPEPPAAHVWKEINMRIPTVGTRKRSKNPRQVLNRALSACFEPLEERTLLSVVVRTAVADTFVQASAPTTNFGSSTNTCATPLSGSGCLVVLNGGSDSTAGLSRITYLKFDPNDDFNTVGTDPFPPGIVNSAILKLVGAVATGSETAKNDEVFGVPDTSWGESTMNFNNRPALDATSLDVQAISGGLKTYNWNVVGWVAAQAPNLISLAVKELDVGTLRHFYRSKEFTTATDRPQLILSVGVPDAPTGLTATPGNGSITLSWSLTGPGGLRVDATSWNVYRGTASGQEQLIASSITTNSYTDTTVSNGVDYFYYIKATNNSGDSSQSAEVGPVRPVVTPAPAPSPITVTEGIGTIALSWDPVPFADTYNIYRSDTSGGNFVLQTQQAETTFNDNVAAGAKFYYKVASVNSAGEGPLSPEIAATAGILGSGTGISADHYDNIDFTGPVISRVEPTINFNWDVCCNPNADPLGGSPDPSMSGDTWSSRYIGDVQAEFTQPYTFYTASDDGARLWIDDKLVIVKWILQGTTEWASQPIDLVAGQKYHIRMDFFENGGAATTFLSWSSPSTPKDIIPQSQLYPFDGVPRLPAAPSVLRADALDGTQVCLHWTDVAFDEDSFVVQRSTTSDFSANVINVPVTGGPNIGECIDHVGDPLAALSRNINTTTVTTPTPHGLTVGSTVIISGATPSSFNGTFTINAVTPTTFSFVNAGPNESATVPGSYVSRYWYRIAAVNAVGTSVYTYSPAAGVLPQGAPNVNYASFPADNAGWALVTRATPPGASIAGNRLRLVPAANDAFGAAWLTNPKIIDSFTASFDFQISGSNGADGFTFAIQTNGLDAIGGGGGALGFAGMPNSVGLKFDFYPNINHSGVYTNGNMNDNVGVTVNTAINVGAFGIDFDGTAGTGNIYHVDIAYDGAVMLYTITDTTDRTKVASVETPVDIAGTVGSHCAYVGFTAANGGLHAAQEILNFTFTPGAPLATGSTVINGTTAPDNFYVRLDSPGGNNVRVWKNHNPDVDPADAEMPKSSANLLPLSGGAGADTFTIDFSNGNPLPAGGLLVDGGQNNDTLIVKGTSAAESFLINGTQVTVPGGATFRHQGFDFANFNLGDNTAGDADDSLTITASPGFSPVLNGGGGNNTLTISGGTYNAAADNLAGNNDGAGNATLNIVASGGTTINASSSQHLKSLTLNDTSKLVMAPGGNKLLRTRGLTIASGAALDVGDNDVILQSTAANKLADWNGLMGLLRLGRSGGLWTGNGIRSATAAANPAHATGIGIVLNDNGSGSVILPSFNGETVDANSILLKYTYYGDRDLDGDVDADDYAGMDAGFANRNAPNALTFPHQPWRDGDINLSNSVNSDDYFMIDNAFSNQTGVLSAAATPMAASSSAISKAASKSHAKHRKAAHHRNAMFRVRD